MLENKMFRASLVIIILHVCFLFLSCSAFKYADGSSEKDIQKFKMTKDEMWDELEKLKKENQRLRTQINIYKKDNQRLREENKDLSTKLAKLATLKQRSDTYASKSYELQNDVTKIKMKVLSGDGDLNSAREMAIKLKTMGYEIALIHYASRSNFLQHTVYSTPKFQDEAKRIVSDLGGDTIYKPLSWPSIFDIIVTTGKNP
jgi:septal ring factor EnvC (AmiA/AmiB activator)